MVVSALLVAAVAGCSEPSNVNPTSVVPTPSAIAGDDVAEVLKAPTPSERNDDELELVETAAPTATLEPTITTVPKATPTASATSTPTATAAMRMAATATATPTAPTTSSPSAAASRAPSATDTPTPSAEKVRDSLTPDAIETVTIDLTENEVATDEVGAISVTPTPVPTPVRTIPSTADPKQSASEEGDGLQATGTPEPTAVTEIVRVVEVIVGGEDVAKNDSETYVPEVTMSETEDAKVFCSRVTGACHSLEFKEPVTVSLPCRGTFTLRESRRGRESNVGMCARGLSIVSEGELEMLRNYVAMAVEDGSLGSMYVRVPDAIWITGVSRFDPGHDDWR